MACIVNCSNPVRALAIVDAFNARIMNALAALKGQGKFTGGLEPYGFELAEDGESLLAVKREQRAIRKARVLRARGLTLRAVALALEEAGLKSRKGSRFTPTQVLRMLDVKRSKRARACSTPT